MPWFRVALAYAGCHTGITLDLVHKSPCRARSRRETLTCLLVILSTETRAELLLRHEPL